MISFPFDSQITGTDEAGLPIYDRASNSEDLARWFYAFFTNGVFATDGFTVTVSGLTVTVAPGDCLINGRYGYEKNNRTFTIAGGGTQPRIDSVILRLDLSLSARNIELFIKTGTAASNPVPPGLERNEIVWELGIANIYVGSGATSVSAANVTDTRLDNTRCGIVAQAMKTIDTSTYYNQIQADLAQFKTNEQVDFQNWSAEQESEFDSWSEGAKSDFDVWFETLQADLDGDVAANLAARLAKFEAAIRVTNDAIDLNGRYIDNALFR